MRTKAVFAHGISRNFVYICIMTTDNKDNKQSKILPEDKEERKKELKKMFIYSELIKPKFDEGLD